MKLNRFTIIIALLLNLLFICSHCRAEGAAKSNIASKIKSNETIFGHFRAVGNGEETTLSKIFEKETVLAMNSWDVTNEEFLCIVTLEQKKIEDEVLPDRKLSFYKKEGDKLIKRYEYETGYWFLAMYPLSDVNGNLITIWVAGSAYHFNVFSFVDKKVNLVLEDGSKRMPEIVDIDNDGVEEVLISTESWQFDEKGNRILIPDTTRIYKWDIKSYKLIKTVPWKNRFDW